MPRLPLVSRCQYRNVEGLASSPWKEDDAKVLKRDYFWVIFEMMERLGKTIMILFLMRPDQKST